MRPLLGIGNFDGPAVVVPDPGAIAGLVERHGDCGGVGLGILFGGGSDYLEGEMGFPSPSVSEGFKVVLLGV